MDSNGKPVKLLVVDSSAFIRRAPVKDLTDIAYATAGVVAEIKDENTRSSLQVLPYELKIKEATADAHKFIVNFSRKTGDYSNLSVVDLQLLALTYQLCKENLSEDEFKALKIEPTNIIRAPLPEDRAQLKLTKPVSIAGFYLPSRNKANSQSDENNNNNNEEASTDGVEKVDDAEKPAEPDNQEEQVEEGEGEDEDEDEDANEDEWITPENLEQIKKLSLVNSDHQELASSQIKVGCMTADFAMQNVLIQIGIPVLSIDGLLIKVARSYVLRCMTCSSITTNMEKQFCPKCGYKTLERVVVTVDADGNKVYRGRRKPPTKIGFHGSLPMPRGGKHDTFPILSEDQPRAHNMPSRKAMVKNNPMDPDYVYQASPFVTKDVTSRAARLGVSTNRFNNRFSKRH